MIESIQINETGKTEYGIVDENHKLAIIPDHYVVWLYKIRISGKRLERKYVAYKICGLYTYTEYNELSKL